MTHQVMPDTDSGSELLELDLETARAYADAGIMPIAEFVTKYGDQLND